MKKIKIVSLGVLIAFISILVFQSNPSDEAIANSCSYEGIRITNYKPVNEAPKCVSLVNNGATDIYTLKYDFNVTGISTGINN